MPDDQSNPTKSSKKPDKPGHWTAKVTAIVAPNKVATLLRGVISRCQPVLGGENKRIARGTDAPRNRLPWSSMRYAAAFDCNGKLLINRYLNCLRTGAKALLHLLRKLQGSGWTDIVQLNNIFVRNRPRLCGNGPAGAVGCWPVALLAFSRLRRPWRA